jgi:hypothetical protein
VIVSTTVVALASVDAAEVVVVAKALAFRVPTLTGEGPLLLTAALLELLFPAQFVAA